VLELGQEKGTQKRGGTLVQGLHQTSQGFFKGGASTSGQRQRQVPRQEAKAKGKERHNKVKRAHKELRGAFFKG
jgi:hypothetical protein